MTYEKVYPAITGNVDEYPSDGCTARATCRTCPRWKCTRCTMLRPWCIGVGGPHPGWCDLCWANRHRRGQRPCPCGDVEART